MRCEVSGQIARQKLEASQSGAIAQRAELTETWGTEKCPCYPSIRMFLSRYLSVRLGLSPALLPATRSGYIEHSVFGAPHWPSRCRSLAYSRSLSCSASTRRARQEKRELVGDGGPALALARWSHPTSPPSAFSCSPVLLLSCSSTPREALSKWNGGRGFDQGESSRVRCGAARTGRPGAARTRPRRRRSCGTCSRP